MELLKASRMKLRLSACALAMAAVPVSSVPATAASFTSTVFADGSAVSATQADSVSFGNGSVWVEYGNGASSRNYSGKSTIVQYSQSGMVQNKYSIAGEVDGLKVNPNTGMVWVLQNQDANSQLSIINPSTKAISTFTYGAPYTASFSTRGFDDLAFVGNSVYLSETNLATASDPVVVKLNGSTPSSPITQTAVVTARQTGLATDADSLGSTPTGGLILSGENNKALNFITNPGQANQTVRTITLTGAKIAGASDTAYATSTSGTFYMTDGTSNLVYAVSAVGLTPGSLFVNVGSSFSSVDPNTGMVTPLVTGVDLNGLTFVPSTTATPEPTTLGICFLAAGFGAVLLYRRRLS